MIAKIYVITAESYDDYHIVGLVQGNSDYDMTLLYNTFRESDASDNLYNTEYYERFTDWLVKEHGFIELDIEEFWCD
jgi:hypothetical protein